MKTKSRRAQVGSENAAAGYFVERAKPPLRATLMMYRNAFSHLQEKWPDVGVAALQHQVEAIAPEATLFTVWQRLVALDAPNKNDGDRIHEYMRSIQAALSRVLDEAPEQRDLEVLAEVGSPARDAAQRYVELLKQKG
jgi:hypothetical protein